LYFNTTGSDNVANGQESLYHNITGNGNIANGKYSLQLNTIGSNNIAIGPLALQDNISGNLNTAVGSDAGRHSTGNSNVFLGFAAGVNATGDNKLYIENQAASSSTALIYGEFGTDATTTGNILRTNSEFQIGDPSATGYKFPTARGSVDQVLQTDATGTLTWQDGSSLGAQKINDLSDGKSDSNGSSVFLGIDAGLNDDQTSNNNVGIGYKSLQANTTGSKNVATGSLSMYYNITGTSNIATGFLALYFNTTGSKNVAIGDNSLSTNHTGFENTATGYLSLAANNTGSNNTATGMHSLRYNELGNYNTAYGSHSLFGTIGDRNVGIGYKAGYFETGSDKLYIENSDADADNALIYGEFDTNLLKFNGEIIINNPLSTTTNRATILNDKNYSHFRDNNIDFGIGGNDYTIASQQNEDETSGLHGNGNFNILWSPGDSYQLRILDEDRWNDNDGNPYNNAAEVAYIDNSGQYFQASDKNRKQNINKLTNALSKIKQINGYTYQYKLNSEEIKKGQKLKKTSGIIAQELYKILPEAVQISGEGEYFVHYAGIIPLLIESIKELTDENELLKKRVENTESLEKRMAKIETLLLNSKK